MSILDRIVLGIYELEKIASEHAEASKTLTIEGEISEKKLIHLSLRSTLAIDLFKN